MIAFNNKLGKRLTSPFRFALAIAIASSNIAPAMAQDAPINGGPAATDALSANQPREQVLGDIVVTAQRRSENLQDVPLAVTAVGAVQLARSGITKAEDLAMVVPGLTIQSTVGYATPHIRGVGQNTTGPGIENHVSLYIDGVYIANGQQALLTFNNVERIEVLKGPQGTLFGRNATGGLVHLITRDPSFQTSVEGDITYGNYDYLSGRLYATTGLTSNLAIDLAVVGTHQGDGWGTNLVSGRDVYAIDHEISARSKLLWTPGPDTRVVLAGDYLDRRNSMNAFTTEPGTRSPVTGARIYNTPGWDVETDREPLTDGWAAGGSLRIEHDFGNFRVMSLSSYRESSFFRVLDVDFTPTSAQSVDTVHADKTFTQELQLGSSKRGPFQWVAGVYYFDSAARFAPNAFGLPLANRTITTRSRQGTDSVASYAQATYEILPETNLTLGGRYSYEKRTLDGSTTTTVRSTGVVLGAPTVVDRETSFEKFTFRIALDHHFTDDVMGYVSFNRGFKSGGYNAGAITAAPFLPEQLDSYAVGLKLDLFDRRARLNIEGFYYDYKNVQTALIQNGAIGIVNGAAARIYGIDADLELLITPDLRLNAGFELLDDKFTSFPNAPTGSPQGGVPLTLQSAKGNRLPYAVAASATAAVTYTAHLAGQATLDFNVTAQYSDGWFTRPDNFSRQNQFGLLNGSIKWTSASDLFSVSVWAKNVTNKRYDSFGSYNATGSLGELWAAPRTFGVTAGFKL